MLNVLFGQIIDRFATLRDDKSTKEEDMHGRCFICNLERLLFDKFCDGGFQGHIKKDHNMWMYVFYIAHLDAVDTSDHNGIESYVQSLREQSDNKWLPRMNAISLQGQLDGEDDEEPNFELIEQMATLSGKMTQVTKVCDEILDQIK